MKTFKTLMLAAVMLAAVYPVNSFAQTAPAMTPAMTTQPAAMPVAAMPAPTPAPAMPAAMPAPAPAMPAPTVVLVQQPTMSAAPAGKKDSSKSVVIGGLLEILLYIVGALLVPILPVLTASILKKLKVNSVAAKEAVDELANKAAKFGLNYAEEKARAMGDNPMDGAEKKAEAVKAAQAYMRDSGMVEKGAEYMGMLVESKLGESRNGEPKKPAPATETKSEG